MENKGHDRESRKIRSSDKSADNSNFVLDKIIFSNVFEKDIRRIYIYRKSERLAKAIHLITPAFSTTPSLRNRLDAIAVGLIDAAILPPATARGALSHELLALSSFLSVARAGELISEMNADLIAHETHTLLQEIAGYQEPRLSLEEIPTLAEFARQIPRGMQERPLLRATGAVLPRTKSAAHTLAAHSVKQVTETADMQGNYKGHISDRPQQSNRQEAIISILQSKGPSYIKDISTIIRDVSEKTIQRELQSLVSSGKVLRSGERRWTQYYLPGIPA